MLAYIKGTLEIKMTDYVVIDVGGLGYKVYMSAIGMEKLGNIGDKVKVYTYYRVREDDISIFGFNTNEELRMFELILSVSGVGAKTALTIIAVTEPSEFAIAVISDDVSYLTKIPGIGAKSAQRIILELKDKMKKENSITKTKNLKLKEAVVDSSKVDEAISALQVLGYNKKEIEKVFMKLDKKDLSTEDLIRKDLECWLIKMEGMNVKMVNQNEPLAYRVRPKSLEEYVGQEHVIGKGKILYRTIKADRLSSIILFGPPGCGKTSLARVISETTKYKFYKINAVSAGVSDIKRVIEETKNFMLNPAGKSILFIDEIHRFNKLQQDALLPYVENGTIILIGATTENPYFEVNKALISRSMVIKLEPLTIENIYTILKNALKSKEGLRRI